MQNVAQGSSAENQKLEKVNAHEVLGKSSTPQSSNSSPTKSETDTFSELQPRFMTDSSESEDDVSEVICFFICNRFCVPRCLHSMNFMETSCGIGTWHCPRQCKPASPNCTFKNLTITFTLFHAVIISKLVC